jgi:hypothetical protein
MMVNVDRFRLGRRCEFRDTEKDVVMEFGLENAMALDLVSRIAAREMVGATREQEQEHEEKECFHWPRLLPSYYGADYPEKSVDILLPVGENRR